MSNFKFDAKGRLATADDLLILNVLNERYGDGNVKSESDGKAVRESVKRGDRTTEFYKTVEAARKRNG